MNIDLALARLALYKELGGSRFYKLTFRSYKGTIRVSIVEMDTMDRKIFKNMLNIPLTFLNARMFYDMVAELPDMDVGEKKSLELLGPKWVNNKRTDEIVKIGEIGVAKAKNKNTGDVVNLLMVHGLGEKPFIFPLLPSPYIKVKVNGEVVEDKTLLSNIITKAYIRALSDVLAAVPEAAEIGYEDNKKIESKEKTSSGVKVEEDVSADIDDLF